MIKLLLALLSVFAIGVATLQMRQQQLELRHQAASLQGKIQGRQSKLWTQQLQIAIYTAPNALAKTLGQTAINPTHTAGADTVIASSTPNE